jgi:drug/metabolite transporter (DMT)-like permease
LRQLAGNAAYFLNILAMSNLPIGVTMILFNTAPFWSVLFGKLINGTHINCVQICLMIGSFIGVVLVAVSNLVGDTTAVLEDILDDIDEISET